MRVRSTDMTGQAVIKMVLCRRPFSTGTGVVSGPTAGAISPTADSRPAAFTVTSTVSAGPSPSPPAARSAAVTTVGLMTSVPARVTLAAGVADGPT
jgi:hypothetical protein